MEIAGHEHAVVVAERRSDELGLGEGAASVALEYENRVEAVVDGGKAHVGRRLTGGVIAGTAGDQRTRTNARRFRNRIPALPGLEADGTGRCRMTLEEVDGAVGPARLLVESRHDEI